MRLRPLQHLYRHASGYFSGMSNHKGQRGSVTQPLLQDLINREKANDKAENPAVTSQPLPPPDLYQDPGGGFNTDFTFPQT